MINLCFCIDENYVVMLGAVFESIKDSNSHNDICIYVLTRGVSSASKKRLSSVFSDIKNISVNFVDALDKDIEELEAGGHISSATYIRFEIPDLLAGIDKVLYLDADLVVVDDLMGFWQVDIEGKFVAAVENPFFDRYQSLGMNQDWGYFNAGVLLINCKQWRDYSVKKRALAFLTEYKSNALMFDQDALNSVFSGDWVRVDPKWNMQTIMLRRFRELKDDIKIQSAVSSPKIIHYSTSSKPWYRLDSHPMREIFLDFQDRFVGGRVLVRQKKRWALVVVSYVYWRIYYMLTLG